MFLFCGDRAWAAITSHIKGYTCSLGRLSLLTPNTSMISQHEFLLRGKHSIHKGGNVDQTAVESELSSTADLLALVQWKPWEKGTQGKNKNVKVLELVLLHWCYSGEDELIMILLIAPKERGECFLEKARKSKIIEMDPEDQH
ncbi:hypothetical protein Nmel_012771 [Mimus melanotis]